MIIEVKHKGVLLAMLVKARHAPKQTEFITPDDFKQQVGFIVCGKGREIEPHIHHAVTRKLKGTSEVLILKKGRVRADFYSQKKEPAASHDLFPGDVLILVAGGHGFHAYRPSVFLEIKQGPYAGPHEKERF